MTHSAGPAGKRRQKSATESLLSIVLALEAVLMFFVALAVFRFDVLSPAAAFGGAAGAIVVMLVIGRLVRYRAGVWAGWAVQLALIATGFLLPLLFFIGAGFAVLWAYCFFTGVRLDRRNAALRQAADSITPPNDSPPSAHTGETHTEEQQ